MHGEAWLIMGASLICKAIILRKAGAIIGKTFLYDNVFVHSFLLLILF